MSESVVKELKRIAIECVEPSLHAIWIKNAKYAWNKCPRNERKGRLGRIRAAMTRYKKRMEMLRCGGE